MVEFKRSLGRSARRGSRTVCGAMLMACGLIASAFASPASPASAAASQEAAPAAQASDQERLAAIAAALLAPRVGVNAPKAGEPAEILEATGSPGSVAIWGPGFVPLVLGGGDGSARVPVMVLGQIGKGRVVAAGHNGYTALDRVGPGARALLGRCGAWLAGEAPSTAGVVAVGASAGPWAAALGREGVDVAPRALDAKTLENAALLVLGTPELSAAQGEIVLAFVQRGGGLMVAQTGWGWQQIKGGAAMTTNALNIAFAGEGLAWTDGFAGETTSDGYTLDAAAISNGRVRGLLDGSLALDALIADSAKGDAAPESRKLDAAQRAQASVSVINAARSAQRSDTILLPRLEAMLKERGSELTPMQGKPLRARDGLARALLAYDLSRIAMQKPGEVRAHAGAAGFPGRVPAEAARVTRDVSLDVATPGWRSLGLYAPPGEVIRVTSKVSGTGNAQGAFAGLGVRIGCHTDSLWHKDAWNRVPEISMRVAMAAPGETLLASPFGGLVYIDVPEGRVGTLDVRIEGAVESPLFVLGQTTPEAWKVARAAPGPWAELASEKIIVSVPSALVRELENPGEVMEFWDTVADRAADLATWPRERVRPERYVADIQISAGYMHSGYPIMTHLDAAPDMVSVEKLRAGTWGLYHELGHNHQSGDWTFDGTGEVTVNLFSMYILENACGLAMGTGHEALAQRAQLITQHAAKKPEERFEHWKREPFVALVMYQQLREAFGWEAYKDVFRAYRELPDRERPRTEEAKRDQWMVRFSKRAGKNLGPFFEAWGVPVSQGARDQVKDLPAWMPPDMGPLVGG